MNSSSPEKEHSCAILPSVCATVIKDPDAAAKPPVVTAAADDGVARTAPATAMSADPTTAERSFEHVSLCTSHFRFLEVQLNTF